MSITIVIANGSRTFALSLQELVQCYMAAEGHQPTEGALGVVFGIGEAGESRPMRCENLVKALNELLAHQRMLPRIKNYYIFGSAMPGQISATSASGCGGMRIHGEIYAIEAGGDKCDLLKMTAKPDGKGEVVSIQDVRTLKWIDTDNMGRIEIRCRTRPSGLVRTLRALREFLRSQPSDEMVTVIVG